MNNTKNKIVPIFLAVSLIMVLSAQQCLAGLHGLVDSSDYTGSLSNGYDGGSGLYTQDGWTMANGLTKIDWNIVNNGTYFTYNYTFTVPQYETSHIIIEVSSNFTDNDYWGLSGELNLYNGLPNQAGQTPNPDMPDEFYGIKFDITTNGNLVETISFNSSRMPMWGNFYAKDGAPGGSGIFAVAYNTGLDPAVIGGAYIPVPDTVVPVPPAVILGMIGMGVAGIKLRKFA